MKYPDVGRYTDDQLDGMLYSYRRLSQLHGEQGHFALATWARKQATHITIELNKRIMAAEAAKSMQMRFDEKVWRSVTDDDAA